MEKKLDPSVAKDAIQIIYFMTKSLKVTLEEAELFQTSFATINKEINKEVKEEKKPK